jgi:altronate hydrolase
MRLRVLQLDSRDNVLVALTDLKRAESVEWAGRRHVLKSDVPAKHKFATTDLAPGDRVVMYGVLVGEAVKPIAAGELLTVSNIRHQAASFHQQSELFHLSPPDVSRWSRTTFAGYVRSDGQVGTRNYWLVVPLVFCENKNIQVLKQAFEEELGFAAPQLYRRQVAELARLYREDKLTAERGQDGLSEQPIPPHQRLFENVDGIRFPLHEGGCGGTREDQTISAGCWRDTFTIPMLPERRSSAWAASMRRSKYSSRRFTSALPDSTSRCSSSSNRRAAPNQR